MPTSRQPRRFTQSDLRTLIRIIPLLTSWKLVLLLIVVALVVQYSRGLQPAKPVARPPESQARQTAEPKTQVETEDHQITEESQPEQRQTPRKSDSTTAHSNKSHSTSQSPSGSPPSGWLDLSNLSDEQMQMDKVVLKDLDGKVIYRGSVNLKPTLQRIDRGKKLPFPNDGAIFGNRERRLPQQTRNYYHEWVHPTQGLSGPGPQRIVTGEQREIFYTSDHYKSFHKVR